MIEYKENYSDTSGRLWQFKRDKVLSNTADLTIDNCKSLKCKAALVRKTADAVNNTNSSVKSTKVVVPLIYLSNFCKSLGMPLTNFKILLELNWIKDSFVPSAIDSAKFKIADAKLHFPVVTLYTEDNFTKQSSDGFKRSVYWNSYQTIPAKVIEKGKTYMSYLVHHLRVFKEYLLLLILLL